MTSSASYNMVRWAHGHSEMLRAGLGCQLDLSKVTDAQMMRFAREKIREIPDGSQERNALYGRIWRLLQKRDARTQADPDFGRNYATDPGYQPNARVLLVALCINEEFRKYCPVESLLPWEEQADSEDVCEGNTGLDIMLNLYYEQVLATHNDWIRNTPKIMSYLFPEGLTARPEAEMDVWLRHQMKEKILALSPHAKRRCYEEISGIVGHPVDKAYILSLRPVNPRFLMTAFVMAHLRDRRAFEVAGSAEGYEFNEGGDLLRVVQRAKCLESFLVKDPTLLEPQKAFMSPPMPTAPLAGAGAGIVARRMPFDFSIHVGAAVVAEIQSSKMLYNHVYNRDRSGRLLGRTIFPKMVSAAERDHYHEIIPGLYLGPLGATKEVGLRFQRGLHLASEEPLSTDGSRLTRYAVSEPLTDEESLNMEYVEKLSGPGYQASDPSTWFVEAFRKMDEALASGERMLVSCHEGKSCSTTLVAAYLMNRLKVQANVVLPFIQSKHPITQPDHQFFTLLETYNSYVMSRA